ncbi:membrane protein [Candidatus Magnetoovum chiemensis]|nr:membrane protein [Candidatus Magnetoovum chiemensis]
MGLSIFISYVSFDSARIVVSFVMLVGSLTTVYYLISTFKGLCVNLKLAVWAFPIMVIVIMLTDRRFIFMQLPLSFYIFGVPANLLFFVIMLFFVIKALSPSCIR